MFLWGWRSCPAEPICERVNEKAISQQGEGPIGNRVEFPDRCRCWSIGFSTVCTPFAMKINDDGLPNRPIRLSGKTDARCC